MNHFAKKYMMIFCLFILAYSQPNPEDILKKIDTYRGVRNKSFTFDVTINNYKLDGSSNSYTMHAELLNTHSIFLTYTMPTKDKDKVILMNGKNLWYKDPKSKRPLRITPQQRLVGEASNGDVASTDFSGDYNAKLIESDNEGTYKLELSAKDGGFAAYKKIHLVANKSNLKPKKAYYYAASGKLLKTALFKEFKKFPAFSTKPIVTKIEIINAENEKSRTDLIYTDYQLKDIPKSKFNANYLRNM